MTKLSDIIGYAENWPKKKDLTVPIIHDGSGQGLCVAAFQDGKQLGFNQVIDQTSSLGIGIDEEMLAKLWFENYFDDQWEDCSGIERALILQVAKALARQSHKFLRIEKE